MIELKLNLSLVAKGHKSQHIVCRLRFVSVLIFSSLKEYTSLQEGSQCMCTTVALSNVFSESLNTAAFQRPFQLCLDWSKKWIVEMKTDLRHPWSTFSRSSSHVLETCLWCVKPVWNSVLVSSQHCRNWTWSMWSFLAQGVHRASQDLSQNWQSAWVDDAATLTLLLQEKCCEPHFYQHRAEMRSIQSTHMIASSNMGHLTVSQACGPWLQVTGLANTPHFKVWLSSLSQFWKGIWQWTWDGCEDFQNQSSCSWLVRIFLPHQSVKKEDNMTFCHMLGGFFTASSCDWQLHCAKSHMPFECL